ncbi:T9SS type A sorting domain-containing protein [candidate division KSB1 bacterium]|nr:T9SS type A sorting domain-containing protein [candidate division KSB1 bacterium]NIR69505.1 T9SS type A sorting domain-containing protein [candidate division KSB1 bacterium]NIS24273.1 T9SS type A sorting domain-containing protein [candidate division KSB1 bacterium]NIT71188.1 T9SS type A sorting domain-containing protein [candidate division KSB1 bacterium]NIU24892.1 T9SS type A sorting domain-containing protein [candidate division KSB1 bacterium]
MASLRIIILVGITLLAMADFAYPQSINVRLPSDASGEPDNSVNIPIVVGDLTGRGVIAYQGTINYDESVLVATGASSAGTLSGAFGPPTVNISNNGEINVGGFGTTALSDSGTLVNLIFDVVGQSGETTDLIFENFVFNSGDPPASTQDGQFTVSFPTDVYEEISKPKTFLLRQNYPNPFNPETAIPFEVPVAWNEPVRLQIYNVLGQSIKTLVEGVMSPGKHVIIWNGRDASDDPVSSGFYFYKIHSGDFVAVRRMLLVK